MSEDEFTRLFKHMNQRFDSVEKLLAETATKQDVQTIHSAMDGVANRLSDIEAEQAGLGHQLTRHDHWIKAAGPKLGLDGDGHSLPEAA